MRFVRTLVCIMGLGCIVFPIVHVLKITGINDWSTVTGVVLLAYAIVWKG